MQAHVLYNIATIQAHAGVTYFLTWILQLSVLLQLSQLVDKYPLHSLRGLRKTSPKDMVEEKLQLL